MKRPRCHRYILASDRALLDGEFTTHLRQRGLAESTSYRILSHLRYAARWLARRKRSLAALRRRDAPALLATSARACWGSSHSASHKDYKAAFACWFRFREPVHEEPKSRYAWQPMVDDFIQFLETHNGFALSTRAHYKESVQDYLKWQFGTASANWRRVRPTDIWDYAHAFGRGRKAGTLNQDLRHLRGFLTFVHMRGACSAQLIQAIPRFCNYGQATHPQILSEAQRRTLLASFARQTGIGARDFCLTLCMVDLGLRPIEVVRLALTDVNWTQRTLAIPQTKTDRGRHLPLVRRIADALRDYVQNHRPRTTCERLFVSQARDRVGTPMDTRAVAYAIKAAYRRCGFPARWSGAYRLRHTFATRLHARGTDLKQIADLLGHQHLQTTTLYAKVDPIGLRALALPWPL